MLAEVEPLVAAPLVASEPVVEVPVEPAAVEPTVDDVVVEALPVVEPVLPAAAPFDVADDELDDEDAEQAPRTPRTATTPMRLITEPPEGDLRLSQ